MQYEIKLEASGEVRDAGGTLISTHPVESTVVVTQEQLDEIVAAHNTEGEK